MTAACPGGGSSQPKLGTEAVVGLASGYIAQLLESSGQPELLPLVPLLVLPSIVTNHFCGSDPPPMVALTQAESDALLNFNLGPDFSSGLPKVANIVLNGLWSDICECSSGSATLPTPPALPPLTVVTINPAPGQNQPCQSYQLALGIGQPGGCAEFGPNTHLVAIFEYDPPPPASGQTAVTITGAIEPNPGPSPGFTLTVQWVSATQPTVSQTFNIPRGATSVNITSPSPGPTYVSSNANITGDGTGAPILACWTFDIWCGGTVPNGTQQPCCPPDTATQATLDAILKMVTLIQRYHVPFAYQLGAVHSGLPQSGSFQVSGLLGLKLDVVKTADGRPVLPGTPPYYWDQGWCSVMDGNGFIQEVRLTRQSQVWFPKIMQDATTVGWWLEPNTQLTITEIEAEV